MYRRRIQPRMLDYVYMKLLESASRFLRDDAPLSHVSKRTLFAFHACGTSHPEQPSENGKMGSQRCVVPSRKLAVPSMSAAAHDEAIGPEGGEQKQSGKAGKANSNRCDILDDMMAGSPVTLQQWVFQRYAILSTMKRSELLGMLHRRHELAMAFVARSHLDSLEESQQGSADTSLSGSEQQPRSQESTEQQSLPDSPNLAEGSDEDSSDAQKSLRKRPTSSVQKASESQPQSFAMRPNESFKEWVDRLCRVAYAPQMPYTQFVAAVGMQLLLQANRSKDEGTPKASVLVECLLAIEAHSLAPLLLDAETQKPATRDKVEQVVQIANESRGVDYSVDRNDQQALSLLARQLHRLQAGKDKEQQKLQQQEKDNVGQREQNGQPVNRDEEDPESKAETAKKLQSVG